VYGADVLEDKFQGAAEASEGFFGGFKAGILLQGRKSTKTSYFC
jgi:hypothetical protein